MRAIWLADGCFLLIVHYLNSMRSV